MRKIKQGKRGQTTKYISRTKAIRKLQLSLKDFRRMCILKGVYPREPPKKLKRTSKTYYHAKDINFLALDPMIQKMRAIKIHSKKYKKAKAKKQIGKIQYLAKNKPKLSLNHLVRERYPDFTDALRDLDDPLSLMALFTIFPTHKQFNLSGDKIQSCTKLLKYFELFVIKTHALRKVFVSLKGIYYQCQILNQKITYIVPFKYPANLPIDVDYRVMSTFLDFYLVLLKFVNFKLYSTLNLSYPPIQKDSTIYQGYQFQQIKTDNQDQRYKIDQEFKQVDIDSQNLLFSNLKFYLSTQVPRYSLQYVILAFGGQVFFQNNQSITHVVTDRDNISKQKNKQYIQPQWIYDSVNFQKLLNVKEYQVGKNLPPHLSPFVDQNDQHRHIPERQKQLKGFNEPVTQIHKKAQKQDKYDIIEQKKSKLQKKKQQIKQSVQIAKNVMSNKDRKLLKVMQKSVNQKKEMAQRLKDKSKKLKAN